MNDNELIKQAASAFGKVGGKSTFNKRGAKWYKELQKKSVEAKKKKKLLDNNVAE